MISLESAVSVILFLIGGGLVFGLLWYAVSYCEKEFPSPFWRFARVAIILLAVFVVIGIIMSMMGHPIVRLERR